MLGIRSMQQTRLCPKFYASGLCVPINGRILSMTCQVLKLEHGLPLKIV